uniref:Ciliary microtubule inner protein 2A-C-like domain-containing protein n=1 Tax=Glossina brevipalpis TaxID=37001 RepID=A0A1A9W9F8_9MUSC
MDMVITPEPHFIPGYTGHCPEYRYREGKTYGKLTHKLLIDPCTKHAPELIVTTPMQPLLFDYPTEKEIKTLENREKFVDAIYKHPLKPGYGGYIPKMGCKLGKRYMSAATAGIAEHEALLGLVRCVQRSLKHGSLLEGGEGVFEPKLKERMMPMTAYRGPLIPVTPRARGVKIETCRIKEEKIPYSKFTVPHFMEEDNEEKFVVNGYSGHIPMAMTRFGQSSKQLSHGALTDFVNNYRHRKSDEWCPLEAAGVASSCPNSTQFVIYHQSVGMIPNYAGHVPGEAYSFGRTYGNATVNAKRWFALHKD